MRSILLLLFYPKVNAVRRELLVSSTHDQLKAFMGRDQYSARTSALQKLLAAQSQGVTPEVRETLSDVQTELKTGADAIVTAHTDVQNAIDRLEKSLESATSAFVQKKSEAAKAHQNWIDAVQGLVQTLSIQNYQHNAESVGPFMQEETEACNAKQMKEMYMGQLLVWTPLLCDLSQSDCKMAIEVWKNVVAGNQMMFNAALQMGQQTYTNNSDWCSSETVQRQEKEAKIAEAMDNVNKALDHESKLAEQRMSALCSGFQDAYKAKCQVYDDYQVLMDQIGSSGSNLSHSDRASEWQGTQVTSCLIDAFLKGTNIDSIAIADCQAEPFVQLNKKSHLIEQRMTQESGTCKESMFSFTDNYLVMGDQKQAHNYHWTETWPIGIVAGKYLFSDCN